MTSFINSCFSSGRQRLENYVRCWDENEQLPVWGCGSQPVELGGPALSLGWITVTSEVPSHMDALLVCCEEDRAKRESEATLFIAGSTFLPSPEAISFGLWLINRYEILSKYV